MRLRLTGERHTLAKRAKTQRDTFHKKLFAGISKRELETVRNVMKKLLVNIEAIDHREENT